MARRPGIGRPMVPSVPASHLRQLGGRCPWQGRGWCRGPAKETCEWFALSISIGPDLPCPALPSRRRQGRSNAGPRAMTVPKTNATPHRRCPSRSGLAGTEGGPEGRDRLPLQRTERCAACRCHRQGRSSTEGCLLRLRWDGPVRHLHQDDPHHDPGDADRIDEPSRPALT
jgi:hypothetical protein